MKSARNQYDYVLRYIYALTGVATITAIALLAALYKGQRAEDLARDRVALYHLASTVLAEQLYRDAQELQALLRADTVRAEPPAAIASISGLQPFGVSGTLYSMGANLDRLRELQDQYIGAEFVATLERIAKRFGTIERGLAEPEWPEAPRTTAALELSIEQLYRLHRGAAANTLARIQSEAASLVPNVAILAAIVVIAVIAGWFVTRLLRESLARQMTAEQELAESQERMHHMQKLEALGQLVGGVAHDFNNLLTVILGEAALLGSRIRGNEHLQHGLGQIQKAAREATSLTNQLLAFSRRQPIEPQVLDLNDLIRGMEPMLQRLIGEDIEIVFDYGHFRDPVELDPDQMRQVILNLCINARAAMQGGGSIYLTTERVEIDADNGGHAGMADGCYVKTVLTDTGIGMDKETRDRAFEPFFTTKPRGRGTGLGLATAHGIVAAANGHIFVDSRPGKGTRFRIYLPISSGSLQKPATQPAQPQRGSETVLIVEDEEQIRGFLADGLSSLGYEVLTASDGAEGLRICDGPPGGIDVIVADVVMPRMNGASFMKEALQMQPGALGIYMSGYTDEIVLQRGVGESAIPLINKPFELGELASLIRVKLATGAGKPQRPATDTAQSKEYA